MADMNKALEKFVTKSFFAYNDGDSVEYRTKTKKNVSYGSIEEAFISKSITISDFFLALGVMNLKICNLDQLMQWLKWFKLKYPEKAISCDEVRYVAARLGALTQQGILSSFTCQESERLKEGHRRGIYYGITEKGAHAVKRVLDIGGKCKYNCWPSITPAYAMLRHLNGIEVLGALFSSRYLYDFTCHEYINGRYGDGTRDLVASVNFNRVDETGKNELVRLFIEPIHLSHSEHIRSMAEIVEDIEDRIEALIYKRKMMLGAKERKYSDVKIVFVIDCYDAFKLLSSIITAYDKSHPDEEDISTAGVYVTSTELLYNRTSLRESFLYFGTAVQYPEHWIFDEL